MNGLPRLRALHGVLLLLLLLLLVIVEAAMAQPFGLNRGAPPSEVGGFAGWILAKQAEFYRMLSGLIRAAKADGSAAYTLLGVSFLYGVFHAAGPGHGKAVISSYLVANNETWRRGIVLSFASAILQALTAIAVVGVAAALLGATAKAMGNTVRVIEIVSYALILLIGLRLLWVKGRAFLQALGSRNVRTPMIMRMSMVTTIITTITTMTTTMEASAWSHGHAPEPSELAGAPLAKAWPDGDHCCWPAPVFGRDHRARVCARAGTVLDRRRFDLCDGARDGNYGGGDRHFGGGRAGACRQTGESKAGGRSDYPARIGNRGGPCHCCCSVRPCSPVIWQANA